VFHEQSDTPKSESVLYQLTIVVNTPHVRAETQVRRITTTHHTFTYSNV